MASVVHALVLAASQPQYKGKLTHRSWPELPEEIIRIIASFYLHELASTNYCPQTWEARKLWYSRMAYTCIRDSQELEKSMMSVCPEWRKAIEKHFFWNQALHVIDPNDHLIYHSTIYPNPQLNASSNAPQALIHLTPYQHLKNIMKCSCVICRINYPTSNTGLAMSKRLAHAPFLGPIPLCKEHDKNRTTYCGLCLRDFSPPGMKTDSTARDYELQQQLGIVENEDEDSWPNVEMTCRKCRTEWLWRRACGSARDRDAVGGPSFQCHDWEARQSIDNFLELAEGTIADVLMLAREKFWLRMNTNYADLGNQLLASQKSEQRYNNPQEEEEDESEDDRDGAFVSGSAQVREISLAHWARRRILDGHWLSPADIWYGNRVLGQAAVVATVHPCPWAREPEIMDSMTGEEPQHPLKATILGEIPPSFQLCEQAYLQHMKAIREVLGPPMKNIVRKIVMESQVPTPRGFPDPAQISRKMTLEDVMRLLREEEGVWYDGVDWVERKRNEEEESSRRQSDDHGSLIASVGSVESSRKEEDSDSTTSSSSSGGSAKSSSTHGSSTATSPVLSTTTLQTTPSPPPLGDDSLESAKKDAQLTSSMERKEKVLSSRPRFIPFDPVKSPPRLLGTIPYIPVTVAHLPQYSTDAIKAVWREACSPLYHCTCSICERAKFAEINARAMAYAASCPPVVPSQPSPPTLHAIYPTPAVRPKASIDTAEIELKEVSEVDIDGDGEEEIDYEASELEYDEDEDDEDEELSPYTAPAVEYRYSPSPGPLSPGPELSPERPRKRSSDELEDMAPEGIYAHDAIASPRAGQLEQCGTSPKRARVTDPVYPSTDEDAVIAAPGLAPPTLVLEPVRQRKRSSEELDDALGPEPPSPKKRVKMDEAAVAVPDDGENPVSAASRKSDIDGAEIVYSPAGTEGDAGSHVKLPLLQQVRGVRAIPLVTWADINSLISLEDADKQFGE